MEENPNAAEVFRDHRRQWRDCLYVYPVIARRSKGLSIGINLNPDQRCNYSCVYCQVDRARKGATGVSPVALPVLRDELALALAHAKGGQLWHEERFAGTPKALRRINDIAFSGDGEPTCVGNFDRAVAVAAEAKAAAQLPEVKLVVITNATNLQSPQVRRALAILDAHNGEIWAKLDAGTPAYFQRVNRPAPAITLDRIVENIAFVAQGRPILLQTLLMNLAGQPPSADEIAAYCGRVKQILSAGGKIKLIQVHTVARQPAEEIALPLTDDQLNGIADVIRAATGVKVETYAGVTPGTTR